MAQMEETSLGLESKKRRPRLIGRRFWRFAAIACVMGGVVLLGSALLIPAKAWLGGVLLEQSFEARRAAPASERADPTRWRPWPWADLAPIGRVSAPRLGEERIILDSASGEALAWGVGHVRGTAGLGSAGVTAVGGHRDGVFAFLGEVAVGDVIEVTPLEGPRIQYEVVRREVVDSRHQRLPILHRGPDLLVLSTCWPLDSLVEGPERFVITAKRISAGGE